MVNVSRDFYTSSRELVEECDELYDARLDVGYIETWQNPADAISKYEKNPIEVCNSRLYRFWPELTMEENVKKSRKDPEEKALVLHEA